MLQLRRRVPSKRVRRALFVLVSVMAPAAAHAQWLPASAIGARARLARRDGHREVGVVTGATDSVVLVATCSHCSPDSVRLADLKLIDVAVRPPAKSTYAAIALGALAGAAAGSWLGRRSDANCKEVCGLGSFLGLVGGATTGLVVGAVVGNRPRWRRVWPIAPPLDEARRGK